MGGPGALSEGRPVTPVTGSVQVVLPRDGHVLGFYAAASTSVVLYDSATAAAAAAGNQILNVAACAVGWNPFPVALDAGLCANVAAAVTFVVQ